jgi:hypothetical protein
MLHVSVVLSILNHLNRILELKNRIQKKTVNDVMELQNMAEEGYHLI